VAAMERKQQKTLVKHARDPTPDSSRIQFVGIVDPSACDNQSVCLRSPAGGRVMIKRDEPPPGIDLSTIALPSPPTTTIKSEQTTFSNVVGSTDSSSARRKAHKHGMHERFSLQTWGISHTCARTRPRDDADYRESVLMNHFKRGWSRPRRTSLSVSNGIKSKSTSGRGRRSAGGVAASSSGNGIDEHGVGVGGLGSPGGTEVKPKVELTYACKSCCFCELRTFWLYLVLSCSSTQLII
jgi:hypothetical protein